ncbi:MAG: Gfo/Idh/MocA family oxidoreductase [Clostridia bacterium]|nr:Gfo/Idh/MocA family oxidoreductase [Clostridia bacterium]
MKKLKAVILGYGGRGSIYGDYAADLHPEALEIVAIADPNKKRQNFAAEKHKADNPKIYNDWKEIAAQPKMADFAVIATQDAMHLEQALAMIEKGYHLLLEKPMATTPEDCKKIVEAAEKKGVKIIVCHVLRFTKFWYTIKEILDRGEIGDVVSVSHFENVGNLHQAHSFVRGSWKSAAESSPMILAKSCHDTDMLQWLIGKECKKVQSFGSLTHFCKENQPAGAPHRCSDGCPHAETCVYNAQKVYLDDSLWYKGYSFGKMTNEEILEELKTSRYGVCVYDAGNDVVDHQVVNMEFEGGITASFSMNGFNEGGRYIHIFGTKGELHAVMGEATIDVYSFETREHTLYELAKIGEHINAGHGGGDIGIMDDAMKYFNDEPASKGICSARTSYISHLIAFAAEESRLTGKVIDLEEYSKNLL